MSPTRASAEAVLLALTLILIMAVSPAASHSGAAASSSVEPEQPNVDQAVAAPSLRLHTAVPGVSVSLFTVTVTPLLVVRAKPVCMLISRAQSVTVVTFGAALHVPACQALKSSGSVTLTIIV